MTDGPYNESIRGPGNRGLGGIWALLNSIAGGLGSLPQIAADISAIRGDIRFLVGDPVSANPAWTGLTDVIGARQDGPESAMDLIYAIALSVINGITPTVGTINASAITTRQILARIEGSPASNMRLILSQLEAINSSNAVLRDSIGTASTSTPNFTALAWLALIANSTERSADCCENGPVVPVDPFPIPTPFCGTGPAYWQECELRLRYSTNPPDPLDIYALWPPSAMTRAENIGRINSVDGSGGFDPGLGVVNGTPLYPTYPVCIAWSFAATPLLFNYGYTSVLRGTGDKYTNFLSSSSQVPNVGTELKTWLPGEGATARALQANFAFPGGTVVSGKVWISLSEPPAV